MRARRSSRSVAASANATSRRSWRNARVRKRRLESPGFGSCGPKPEADAKPGGGEQQHEHPQEEEAGGQAQGQARFGAGRKQMVQDAHVRKRAGQHRLQDEEGDEFAQDATQRGWLTAFHGSSGLAVSMAKSRALPRGPPVA